MIWHLGSKTDTNKELAALGSTIVESTDLDAESDYTDSLKVQKKLISQQKLLELNMTGSEQEEPHIIETSESIDTRIWR